MGYEENGPPPRYLLFVWKPSGYELVEREGNPPGVGEWIDIDGRGQRVTKVGRSPLPGDGRPCAYLLAYGSHRRRTFGSPPRMSSGDEAPFGLRESAVSRKQSRRLGASSMPCARAAPRRALRAEAHWGKRRIVTAEMRGFAASISAVRVTKTPSGRNPSG